MPVRQIIYPLLMSGLNLKRNALPIQFPLDLDFQSALDFAYRYHHTPKPHIDFRFKMLGTLFCLVLLEDLSFDPSRKTKVKLMPDHNPANLKKEYVIAAGNPGAGASLPVDCGGVTVLGNYQTSQEEEALTQLLVGHFRFRLTGAFLKGDWL